MDEIENAAYEYTKSIDDDERVIVGVNKFTVDDDAEPEPFPIDPQLEVDQIARTTAYKASARHRCGRVGARRGQGGGRDERQPAPPDEGRAAGRLHTRRDQRQPARGLRRLHPVSRR